MNPMYQLRVLSILYFEKRETSVIAKIPNDSAVAELAPQQSTCWVKCLELTTIPSAYGQRVVILSLFISYGRRFVRLDDLALWNTKHLTVTALGTVYILLYTCTQLFRMTPQSWGEQEKRRNFGGLAISCYPSYRSASGNGLANDFDTTVADLWAPQSSIDQKATTWGYICPLNSQPKKDFNTACPSCILYPKETQKFLKRKSRWIDTFLFPTFFSFLSRPPWWAPGRSVLSQNSSATSTLRGKIPSRIRATTQVQIHKNAWFFWNIPYTYIIHSWQMYDWILLCIMKRYQKWAESQNQQYSSAFTRQAKNTTEQRSWSQLFFCAALLPAVDANISRCVVLQSCSVHAFAWDSPCCYTWATESWMDTMSMQISFKWWVYFSPLALKPCESFWSWPSQPTNHGYSPSYATSAETASVFDQKNHPHHSPVHKSHTKSFTRKVTFQLFWGNKKKQKKTTSHWAEIP